MMNTRFDPLLTEGPNSDPQCFDPLQTVGPNSDLLCFDPIFTPHFTLSPHVQVKRLGRERIVNEVQENSQQHLGITCSYL